MNSPSLLRAGLLSLSVLAFTGGLAAQPATPKVDFPAPSPAATLKQRVGLTDIEVAYSRPGVKDRKVFGGLVPFGEVWRTGANTATKLVFSTDVKLNGHAIPAGTYGLFTIPGEREWTIILNKNAEQWGAYRYDEKDDVVRFTAAPLMLVDPVETFTIDINDIRDDSATLDLVWEKTRVPVKIEVDLVGTLVPQIEAAMATAEKKPNFQAAMFYLEHGLDLDKAAAWMDAAIAERPEAFYFYYHKARILAKKGDKDGAIAAAQHSIELAEKVGGPAKEEYIHLNEVLIAGFDKPAEAGPPPGPRPRVSPHATVSARTGDRRTGNFIMVTYGRPYTRDPKTGAPRTIWGGVVPWDKAWRLGANEATTFITNKPIQIGSTKIPAGAYTLYMVPSETGPSKLAFSTNIGKWGAPVDEEHDIARVDMTMEAVNEPVDQLTIAIDGAPDGTGKFKVQWADTQYSVAFAEAM